MGFLQLSTATAATARSCLPDWSSPPRAQLSPGALSSALTAAQERWALLIDATAAATHTHTASLAAFAEEAHRLDSLLAARLGGHP
ncbi:hypothetical protein [Corynebacterium timonense]|uniref:Uncharacterized protein n=1 Tax=Corynebacterium timonense TaxID=441500 RepID=A0A1H1VHX0_9CORY|nr:hypothetical protein [Corynebacterium timonense]SDS84438.1 hypothetical protein SAMN04488539_2514 [Corynebacterium timonense]